MDISAISSLNDSIGISGEKKRQVTSNNTEAFSSLLNSAISMY